MTMEIIGYIASSLVGVVLGLLGGGGSILSIPILVYLFGVEPVLASAYSLFIVGVTSFIGAIPKYRDHLVNLRAGITFGVPSVLAIFFTRAVLVPALPEVIFESGDLLVSKRMFILGTFAFLMLAASIPMIRGRRDYPSGDAEFRTGLAVIEGVVVGFVTGLVGAGGGFLIVPALVFLTGLQFKAAVGTSLLIISINALLGFTGDVINHTMEWTLLLTVTACAVTGIFIGNRLAKTVSGVKLRVAFGWFTLAMGSYILVRELFS